MTRTITRYLIPLLILALAVPLRAQREREHWFMGYGAGLDFTSPPPTTIAGAISSYEAAAAFSDPVTGELLFYSEGVHVWNRLHIPMPNGSGLKGNNSSTQGALIVPMPGSATRYYLFTADAVENDFKNGLRVSVVDMTLDGGRGDVVTRDSLISLGVNEKVIAITRCSDDSFWLIAHGYDNNTFIAWPVTRAGFGAPVVSMVGTALVKSADAAGQMRASHDGRRLALARASGRAVDLFDFDRATGRVSNPIELSLAEGTRFVYGVYGIEFSPDNAKFYGTEAGRIYQFDMTSGVPATIQASRTLLYEHFPDPSTGIGETPGGMSVAPDGKIYVVIGLTDRISIIDRPNALGIAAGYQPSAIRVQGSLGWGVPNFMTTPERVVVTATVSNDTTICVGGAAQLRAAGSDVIHWSPPDGLSCVDCPDPTASPRTTTTYYATVGGGSCRALDSVVVTVRPSLTIGGDSAVCAGATARFRATGGTRYQWRASTGVPLGCPTCDEQVVNPLVTTTYFVEDPDACPPLDSFTVSIVPGPTVSATGGGDICAGERLRLGASGATTYRWEPSTGLSCSSCPDPLASPTVTTRYRVIGSTGAGCYDTAEVEVRVVSSGAVSATGGGAICAGQTMQLRASGATNYQWEPATGLSCTTCPDPIASPSVTTLYRVIGTTGTGCRDTAEVEVRIVPGAEVSVTGGGDMCPRQSLQLHASGATSYRWEPAAGLSCTTCPDPIANPSVSTRYRVIGASANGCFDTAEVEVRIVSSITVAARLDRGVIIGNGERDTLAARTDVQFTAQTITVTFGWNPRVALVGDAVLPPAMIAKGWTAQSISAGSGTMTVQLNNPQRVIVEAGEVLLLPATVYLGDSLATEVTMQMDIGADQCYRLESHAGQIVLDSICGLQVRLFELSDNLLRLAPPIPNPARATALIRYELPFDATAIVEIVDVAGSATRIVDGPRSAGVHEVTANTSSLASGVYEIVLRVGSRTLTQRMVVTK
jgi:hypothetical protein